MQVWFCFVQYYGCCLSSTCSAQGLASYTAFSPMVVVVLSGLPANAGNLQHQFMLQKAASINGMTLPIDRQCISDWALLGPVAQIGPCFDFVSCLTKPLASSQQVDSEAWHQVLHLDQPKFTWTSIATRQGPIHPVSSLSVASPDRVSCM